MVKLSKNMNGVFIIAEIGLNHNGDLKSALDHVEAAKKAGCNAVKFQTYKTEKRIQDPKSKLIPLLKNLELTYKDFEKIKQFSDAIGIEFFSTAFDEEAIDFLSSIGVDLFKVSSFDTSNNDLFEALLGVADKIIFSTGMTDNKTIEILVKKILDRVSVLGILHCVSSYPTPVEKARLANISALAHNFPEAIVGYSDHTTGTLAAAVSIGMGARIVEKHFKLSENHECIDAPVSIGPEKMKELVNNINEAYSMIGNEFFGITDIEKLATQFKRTDLKI